MYWKKFPPASKTERAIALEQRKDRTYNPGKNRHRKDVSDTAPGKANLRFRHGRNQTIPGTLVLKMRNVAAACLQQNMRSGKMAAFSLFPSKPHARGTKWPDGHSRLFLVPVWWKTGHPGIKSEPGERKRPFFNTSHNICNAKLKRMENRMQSFFLKEDKP